MNVPNEKIMKTENEVCENSQVSFDHHGDTFKHGHKNNEESHLIQNIIPLPIEEGNNITQELNNFGDLTPENRNPLIDEKEA